MKLDKYKIIKQKTKTQEIKITMDGIILVTIEMENGNVAFDDNTSYSAALNDLRQGEAMDNLMNCIAEFRNLALNKPILKAVNGNRIGLIK